MSRDHAENDMKSNWTGNALTRRTSVWLATSAALMSGRQPTAGQLLGCSLAWPTLPPVANLTPAPCASTKPNQAHRRWLDPSRAQYVVEGDHWSSGNIAKASAASSSQ